MKGCSRLWKEGERPPALPRDGKGARRQAVGLGRGMRSHKAMLLAGGKTRFLPLVWELLFQTPAGTQGSLVSCY